MWYALVGPPALARVATGKAARRALRWCVQTLMVFVLAVLRSSSRPLPPLVGLVKNGGQEELQTDMAIHGVAVATSASAWRRVVAPMGLNSVALASFFEDPSNSVIKFSNGDHFDKFLS